MGTLVLYCSHLSQDLCSTLQSQPTFIFVTWQVIGAVGFMNQRLEIPKDVEPQWASLIESCWHRFVFTRSSI